MAREGNIEGNLNPAPEEDDADRSREERPAEEQERAEDVERARAQEATDQLRAQQETERLATLAAEQRAADRGFGFVVTNFGKKVLNFGGVLERRTEAAVRRREVYVATAREQASQEQAHITTSTQELEGRMAQLNQYRERMARLRERLESVEEGSPLHAEIQGYVNRYNMLMVPIENAVNGMCHKIAYSTRKISAYSNEAMAYQTQIARSTAYLQVLRTPFSSLWSRDTKISIGTKIGPESPPNPPEARYAQYDVSAFRMVQQEQPSVDVSAAPATESRGPRSDRPTVDQRTTMEEQTTTPEAAEPEQPPEEMPESQLESEPQQREILTNFNPDEVSLEIKGNGNLFVLSRNSLVDLFERKPKRKDERSLNEEIRSYIKRELDISDEEESSYSNAMRKVEKQVIDIITKKVPEILGQKKGIEPAKSNRIIELYNEIDELDDETQIRVREIELARLISEVAPRFKRP